jgi:hypothetical protein
VNFASNCIQNRGICGQSPGWEASRTDCIEPTFETRVHAATSRARLYRNGRIKVAASAHCRPLR